MKKNKFLFLLSVLFLGCIISKSFANIHNTDEINYLYLTGIEFKIGDLVVFKKNNQEILLEGKITEINKNIAVVEYIDPNEPDKPKEYIIEIDKLTKISIIENKSDLEINMPIIFKKVNTQRLLEGKVTAINQTSAIIEYTDPLEQNKEKEYDAAFKRLYKFTNSSKKEVKTENKIEVKTEEIPPIKFDIKIGDFVKFKKLTGIEFEGKVIALKEDVAEVEYSDPSEPGKIKSIEKKVSELTKMKELTKTEKVIAIVKEEKTKEKKIRVKPTYFRNTIAVDGLQIIFNRASIWYEYKPKELIGIRIPVYINWKDLIYSIGINSKFYFNKNKLIQGFAGPEIIGSIKPYAVSYNTIYYVDFLGDFGVSITPIKHLNITVNCGLGLNIDLGHLNTKSKFAYFPAVSVGYNF